MARNIARPFFAPQVRFNHELLEQMRRLRSEISIEVGLLEERVAAPNVEVARKIDDVRAHLEARIDDVSALAEPLGWAVDAMLPVVRDLEYKHGEMIKELDEKSFSRFHDAMSMMQRELGDVVQLVEERLEEFDRRREEMDDGLLDVRIRLSSIDLLFDAVRRTLPAEPTFEQLVAVEKSAAPFFQGLEDSFRGPKSAIRERSKEYLAVVAACDSTNPVLDVGSGRGEWLEVLSEASIPSYGVDVVAALVETAQAAGLDVRNEDVLIHLRGLPAQTLRAVTAFHFVERLEFEQILEFLDEALRVIEPGGVLILETPNPANLTVASSTFHLDPTHHKPLPAKLLEFMVRSRGFGDIEVRFLHPATSAQLRMPALDHEWYAELAPVVDVINRQLFGDQEYSVTARRI
jgi:SAM-dependent methyltransferase